MVWLAVEAPSLHGGISLTLAAIGIVVGAGFYPIALLGRLLMLFVLEAIGKFESLRSRSTHRQSRAHQQILLE